MFDKINISKTGPVAFCELKRHMSRGRAYISFV